MDDEVTVKELLDSARTIEREGIDEARRRICSMSRIVVLADRAADNPDWWRANRLHFFMPELTQSAIGELLGISGANVKRLLKNIEISEDAYDTLPDIKQ